MDVVFGGKGLGWKDSLTRWHRVLMRTQHSPGFGLASFIGFYGWIRENNFKLMLPKYCWDLILKTNALSDRALRSRDQIIKDGTPLFFTHYDPKLNRIYNAPQRTQREPGTALIACNWRIVCKRRDANRLTAAIRHLASDLKISFLFHPMIFEPIKTEQHVGLFLEEQKKMSVEMVAQRNSVEDLVDLYDKYEFVVTDGSGAAYEAIARGCKALMLDGISYQRNRCALHPAAELDLLPQTPVWDHRKHPGNASEMGWLKKLHPTSLVREDVTPFVAEEIIDAFKNGHWAPRERNRHE